MGKAIVNIAVGATSLKLIKSYIKDFEIVLDDAEILDADEMLFISGKEINYNLIESKIMQYLKKNKVKGGIMCFTLPEYLAKTQILTYDKFLSMESLISMKKEGTLNKVLTNLHEDDMEKNFEYQILNAVKTKGQDADDDEDEETGNTELFYTCMDDKIIKGFKKMCKRLKMKPGVLETEACSYLRLVDKFKIDDNFFNIDIGTYVTKVYFFCKGSLLAVDILDFGIGYLTNFIMKTVGCTEMQAQQMLREGGVKKGRLKDAISNYIENKLILPLYNNVEYAKVISGGINYINQFYKTGNGWNINGIEDMIEEVLENKVTSFEIDDELNYKDIVEDKELLEEELNLDYEEKVSVLKEYLEKNIASYASAIGLTERGGL